MSNNIIDKVVLVTGCSSGIGLATALLLKSKGARVIATARKQSDVTSLSIDHYLESYVMDLSSDLSIRTTLNHILINTNNRIDILFHNAGYAQPGAVEDLPTEVLRENFATNFFGVHELTRLVLPHMHQYGGGKIIINSSVLGFVAMPFRSAYNASKFALEGWADTLRLEVYDSGITVSLLEPGPINTQFRSNALKAYKTNINTTTSRYEHQYRQLEEKFSSEKSASSFALSAEQCAEQVYKIAIANKSGIRYKVTVPTYIFATLKRLLPTVILDKLLARGI